MHWILGAEYNQQGLREDLGQDDGIKETVILLQIVMVSIGTHLVKNHEPQQGSTLRPVGSPMRLDFILW